jgi:GrpB-like predicted nucleotidyltransferase (UPF0157 family)
MKIILLIFLCISIFLFALFLKKKVVSKKKIEIVAYDPLWPKIFQKFSPLIQKALGDNCLAIHHFGSTSIQDLSAKPKVDLLAVVKDLSSIDTASLEALGFEFRGEVIPTGRYFSRAKKPKIHLHIFEQGNPLIEEDLSFRDWLRAHPSDRKAYEKLKKELASLHQDGMSYSQAKTEFIKKIIEKAAKEKSS